MLEVLRAHDPKFSKSPSWLNMVLVRYGNMDLELEAHKMVEFLQTPKAQRAKRELNGLFVLNWLRNVKADQEPFVGELSPGGYVTYLDGKKVFMEPEQWRAYREYVRTGRIH